MPRDVWQPGGKHGSTGQRPHHSNRRRGQGRADGGFAGAHSSNVPAELRDPAKADHARSELSPGCSSRTRWQEIRPRPHMFGRSGDASKLHVRFIRRVSPVGVGLSWNAGSACATAHRNDMTFVREILVTKARGRLCNSTRKPRLRDRSLARSR